MAEISDDYLYGEVGALLGVELRSELDIISLLEKGLPVSVVQSLREGALLTDAEVFQLIAPRRTLSRRQSMGECLSALEADKTVRIARAVARTRQVFAGQPSAAIEWLRTAKSQLGHRTPIGALLTETGARAVEEMLIGIEHGMFA